MPEKPPFAVKAESAAPAAEPLAVIGMGEDGFAGLGAAAQQALAGAERIYGGARHLALLPAEFAVKGQVWIKPFLANIAIIRAARAQNPQMKLAVIASGDPMFFGAGASLAQAFGAAELQIFPHAGAFSYAAARLGWPLQSADCLSAHGRPLNAVLRWAADKARLLVLANNGQSPALLAQALVARGFAASRLSVMEHLGGPAEAIYQASAAELAESRREFADLNIIGAECAADAPGGGLPLFTALPDSAFWHDGQLTKQPVRAAVLAALAPKRGELLWDIGAGNGSIGLEWLRLGREAKLLAVERHAGRCANILKNADYLGLAAPALICGEAAACLAGLKAGAATLGAPVPAGPPDAVFIGGGARNYALLEQCFAALKPGGRLAANAVTLEGEAAFMRFASRHNGELRRFAVQNMDRLGGCHILRPALPVTFLLCPKD